ncbi:hypothetical protein HW555_005609 [Spodoptera exigua]|uniref:Uncharacterized protein n=1 Tax=Spodoptera exigua TaxID=7107 RepID=A0A835GI23_SPOEX|nr:hypothetical protein HW555_005609 [Spodoptera exigua]
MYKSDSYPYTNQQRVLMPLQLVNVRCNGEPSVAWQFATERGRKRARNPNTIIKKLKVQWSGVTPAWTKHVLNTPSDNVLPKHVYQHNELCAKKLYGDELLRLALVLSLLKVDPNDYLERETQQMLSGLHISNGSDWSLDQEARTLIRPRYVHPKSLDNILINYERQLFEELNSLGRYDFLHNRTEEDIFAEIASRSFDVNELLVQPSEMQIKKEDEDYEVHVKKEAEDDLYSDNAIDFMPFFSTKTEMEFGETNSVLQQNMADLQEFSDVDEVKELKHDLEYLDVKQQQENLEQYLLENTPLDAEVYELAPMFEEELVLNVKRERASTSFTASSSGVSDMDASSDGVDVKMEPDEGHHTGDELTQEVLVLKE